MIRVILLLIFLSLSPIANSFDISAYCRSIADTAGGSYQIELTCREMERDAKSRINRKQVPDRIMRYCRRIGETAGGSYQIMLTCIIQELNARSQMR